MTAFIVWLDKMPKKLDHNSLQNYTYNYVKIYDQDFMGILSNQTIKAIIIPLFKHYR